MKWRNKYGNKDNYIGNINIFQREDHCVTIKDADGNTISTSLELCIAMGITGDLAILSKYHARYEHEYWVITKGDDVVTVNKKDLIEFLGYHCILPYIIECLQDIKYGECETCRNDLIELYKFFKEWH